MTNTIPQRRRRGFTLIEILVVLTIITILAALSIGVIGAVMTNARSAATSATLTKIDGRIRDRIQTLSGLDYSQYEILAGNLNYVNPSEKKVVARKIAMREAFPQSWDEFDTQFPELATEIVSKFGANTFNPATESAEVLYYILTEGPIPGKGKRKVISGVGQTQGDEFNADTADTDGDGLLEFVDGWGRPLRFYRWPTRLIRPDGVNVQLSAAKILMPSITADLAAKDPEDPYGVMATSANPDQFEQYFHTPGTYHLPLVVSAGKDEILGLYEPTDTANFGHIAQALYTVGPDGQPGIAGVDDDMTNGVDDAGELGWPNSDDVQDIFDNITNLNNSASNN